MRLRRPVVSHHAGHRRVRATFAQTGDPFGVHKTLCRRQRKTAGCAAGKNRALVGGSNEILQRAAQPARSEEHTSELQSRGHLVCRLLLEKKKKKRTIESKFEA